MDNSFEDLTQEELDKEAKKHIRRIKRFISAASKRGYTFSEKAIPKLPQKVTPGTIRKLNKIRPKTLYKKAVYTSPEGVKIKGYKARFEERSKAAKKGVITRKEYAQSRGATASPEPSFRTGTTQLPKEAPTVIENTRQMISTLDDLQFLLDNREINERWWGHKKDPLGNYKEKDYGLLTAALDAAIESQGEEAVAARLQQNSNRISELVTSILYESGDKYHRTGREGMNAKIQEIAEILMGHSLTSSESMQITSMGEGLGVYEQ